MYPAVYVETTIPSYLASRPSRDLIVTPDELLESQTGEIP